MISNHKYINHDHIKNIRVGHDLSWSSNLQIALNEIKEDFIILWLDDTFLCGEVDQVEIEKDIEWFKENKIDYLNMRNSNIYLINEKNRYILIEESEPYRNSIFCTLWNKKVLIDLLRKDENAWQFEFRGSERSIKYKNYFTVDVSRFKYIHGIEKGLWLRTAVAWIKSNKLNLDLNYRRQMSIQHSLVYNLSQLKGNFLNMMPSKYRKVILQFSQKLYLITGLRDKNYYNNK